MIEIIFATGNQNKVTEVNALLPNTIKFLSLKDIGFHGEIPETQPTIEGNAKQKADYIYHEQECNVFSEDTGLEIEALNGEPGVRSARYASEEKNAEANMALVLEKLDQKTNRTARFKTVIALYFDGKYHEFEGILNGTILTEKKGINGFGYDPIFQPEGESRTMAELTQEEKNAISHRGKAVRKLISFLEKETTTS